jgi:hypothetical protein
MSFTIEKTYEGAGQKKMILIIRSVEPISKAFDKEFHALVAKHVEGDDKVKRLAAFRKDVFSEANEAMYDAALLEEFYNYWTEASERARKFRWEREKFFDLSKRLLKFHYNQVTQFGKHPDRYTKPGEVAVPNQKIKRAWHKEN